VVRFAQAYVPRKGENCWAKIDHGELDWTQQRSLKAGLLSRFQDVDREEDELMKTTEPENSQVRGLINLTIRTEKRTGSLSEQGRPWRVGLDIAG
jgi:hypothetical protein